MSLKGGLSGLGKRAAERVPRGFAGLESAGCGIAIAELKKGSPSRGLIRAILIRGWRGSWKAGAALSVLTKRNFSEIAG